MMKKDPFQDVLVAIAIVVFGLLGGWVLVTGLKACRVLDDGGAAPPSAWNR